MPPPRADPFKIAARGPADDEQFHAEVGGQAAATGQGVGPLDPPQIGVDQEAWTLMIATIQVGRQGQGQGRRVLAAAHPRRNSRNDAPDRGAGRYRVRLGEPRRARKGGGPTLVDPSGSATLTQLPPDVASLVATAAADPLSVLGLVVRTGRVHTIEPALPRDALLLLADLVRVLARSEPSAAALVERLRSADHE